MQQMASAPSRRETSFSSEPMRGARYERLEPIATGGMGKVYLGRVRAAGGIRTAAIKVMHPQLVQEADMVAMFLDEARISMRLRHTNIVEVWDMDLVGDELVIVMEYVEGASFAQIIRGTRRGDEQVPIPITGRVVLDALAGLHAAHELTDAKGAPMGLVHRDISPQNLLVGADGVTRLVDFGVALSAGRIASTAPDGAIKGKLSYLAPEQLTRRTVDRRLDIFAAGIVLWEALTGMRLFDAPTEAETVTQVLREPIAPPSSIRPEVSSALDEVTLKALERDPSRRYATAAEFADALRAAVGTLASPEDVGNAVLAVAGEAINRRRAALERLPASLDAGPDRVTTDTNAAVDLDGRAPARSTRRLLVVAALSLLVGSTITVFAVAPRGGSASGGASGAASAAAISTPVASQSYAPNPPPTGVPSLPSAGVAPPPPTAVTTSPPRPSGPAWKPPTGYRPPGSRPAPSATFMPGEL